MFSAVTTVLVVVGVGAAAGAVGTIIASVRRRWETARIATLAAAGCLVLAALLLAAACVLPPEFGGVIAQANPEERTAILANSISGLFNSTFPALPALLIAAPLWAVAARKVRR